MESNPTFFCGVTLTSMSARTTDPDSLTISWLSTALYLRIVPFLSYFAIAFLTDATFSPVNFAISAGLIRASFDNISNISSITDSRHFSPAMIPGWTRLARLTKIIDFGGRGGLPLFFLNLLLKRRYPVFQTLVFFLQPLHGSAKLRLKKKKIVVRGRRS